MKTEIERRFVPCGIGEVRAEKRADGRIGIFGVAAVVESLSEEIYGFREKIAPGAFDKALGASDVRGLFNHDPNMILGRVKSGTMRAWVDADGLRYEIPELPESRGDVAEAIQRGDVDGNSFSFTVAEDSWEYKSDGKAIRTIVEFGELFDVGPVTYPAYPATKVSARAQEMGAARASDLGTATAPKFKRGDRVTATAGHMKGMKGMSGAVNEANAGSPPYYAIDFDEPMGEGNPHKWMNEDEIEAEQDGDDEMEENKKKMKMKMKMKASALVAARHRRLLLAAAE